MDSRNDLSSGNTLEMESLEGRLHVVGIGASAGGLEALEGFFSAVSPEPNMVFIVQQHLSPDFDSQMETLLGRMTSLPVETAQHRTVVRNNTVYVAPPRKEMILNRGTLLLTDRDPHQAFTLPIDRFFRSLAQDAGHYAVGVVLSGTGSDGSRGIREIHAAGGLTIAQTPESARFDGMPKSAIATGCIDLTLIPRDIPQALGKHLTEFDAAAVSEPSDATTIPDTGIREILRLLRSEYGIDFNHYKPNTVIRRIQRRLSLEPTSVDINDYADYVRTHPDELDTLYHDLLIGVTRFFRDPNAFEVIEKKILPHLIETFAEQEEEWRIWIPGCATGEEAYSLAILFDLVMDAHRIALPQLKVFATDVHRHSLEVASRGVYGPEVMSDVDEAIRKRYFRADRDGNFRIVKPIRQSIVFAKHNVIKDAPFTRLHLISCRNLLIYLKAPTQNKVLSLFHFGLRTEGCLFLGPSETPGTLSKEFQPLDTRWKVYKKRRDIRLSTRHQLSFPGQVLSNERAHRSRSTGPVGYQGSDSRMTAIYDVLLDKCMAPSILLDEDYNLVHTFAGAQDYLRFPGGRTSTNILDLIHPDLKTAVSGALQRADSTGKPVRFTGLKISDGDESEAIRLVVEGIADVRGSNPMFLVTMEPLDEPTVEADMGAELDAANISRDYIESLESELRFTKENLQATIEELETTNEELQATNEEMVAANEELQSTNEELHSVNEELHTINAEHQQRIEELTELTNDMDNLLNSIEVGVLFLDHALCVRKFTPSMAETFHLLPQDVGRRFDNFSHNIAHDSLLDDVERVRESGVAIEREVRNRRGERLYLRILPYQVNDDVEGIVLSLIDISKLKNAEEQVSQLSAIVEHSHDSIVGMDMDGRIIAWNNGAEELYGYSSEEALGRNISFLHPNENENESESARALERLRQGDATEEFETIRRHKDGTPIAVAVSISPIRDDDGRMVGVSSIARDITKRKQVEQRLRRAIKQRERFLAMLSHELRNPLMAMLTAAEMLTADTESGADDRRDDRAADTQATPHRAADVIIRQTTHTARILDDLLDVSRMRQDRIEMRRQPFDLRSILRDVLEEVEGQAEDLDIELTVQAPEQPLMLLGDKTRLCQLLANLLTNAFKFTPRGKSVRLFMEQDGDRVVIRVEDEGIGIEAEFLEEIFEPFFQESRPISDTQGMGLGLALVKAIALAHGGEVRAYSDGIDQGSRFVVRLPLEYGDIEPPVASPVIATDGRHRVLLVEDQEDNRELLAMALERCGYEVIAVGTAADGIQVIENNPPNTAVVDIGLPDESGHAVAKRAREFFGSEELRLIALTGYGQQKDRDALKRAGFDHHLVKPAPIALLRQVIDGDDDPDHA